MVGRNKSKASGAGGDERPMYLPPPPRRRSQDEGGGRAREKGGEDDEEEDEDEEQDGERDEEQDADQEERDDGEHDEEVTYAGQDAAPASSRSSITAAKAAFQEVVLLVQEGRARRGLRPVNIAAGARALVAAA